MLGDAFDEFARSRLPRMLTTALALTGNRDTAEDLTQDTLVRLAGKWERLQERGVDLDAYMYRTMVNTRNSWWRRVHRTLPASAPEEVGDIATRINATLDLRVALLRLPERQRLAVVLRYLEGMSEREMAHVMRCSQGTVKSQLARGVSKLRKGMIHEGVEEL